MAWVLLGLLVGGTAGALMAKRVEMTKMPELVAFMHSMIGLAAVFIGIAAVAEPHAFGIAAQGDPIPAGIGFSLNNSMLIIAGSLVGSSGAILSYIMCKAMNRSFFNVILGGFGGEASSAAAVDQGQRHVKSGSADDAAYIMANAETVIIVPGYGLAVARAQHAVNELAEKLMHKGVIVKYAIHPVAGRMPGHMNVLLAEAEVPYDQVFEMEDINGEFAQADVAIVLGANDVVNPAALQKGTPIYGMPILEAYKAKTVIVNKRSMAAGYAGLDNELFYMDKTMMVFGDAKKVVEDMVKAVE